MQVCSTNTRAREGLAHDRQRGHALRQQVLVTRLERSKALFYYALLFLVMASLGSIQIVNQFFVDRFYWLGVVNIIGGLMVPIAGLRASNTTQPRVSYQGVFGKDNFELIDRISQINFNASL